MLQQTLGRKLHSEISKIRCLNFGLNPAVLSFAVGMFNHITNKDKTELNVDTLLVIGGAV